MTESNVGVWWESDRAVRTARICLWVGFPLAGLLWIALSYSDTWYYFDEWSMIQRSLGGWHGILEGHQGHLAVENYLVYRAQRAIFGLDGHELVWAGLCASVVALQLSVAVLLRRLKLPTLLALLAGSFIVFFGPGAQNTLWEFQQNINFALALCFVAGFFALEERKTTKTAVLVTALLVVAVTADSGLAVLGAVFVGFLVVLLWPWRLAAIALVPAAIANLAWYLLGDPGPQIDASWHTMWIFASRLFTLSAAGLVGGGEIPASSIGGPLGDPTLGLSGTQMGTIALVLAAGCVAFGLVRHRVSRVALASLIGGVSAAVLGVAVLAKTRAFLVTPALFPGSRYVQWVAVFLLVGFAPAITETLRPATRSRQHVATAIAAVAMTVVFILNLIAWRAEDAYNTNWAAQVEASVRGTVSILREGCGPGERPDPGVFPAGGLSPQVTVALLQTLVANDVFSAEFGDRPSAELRDAVRATKPR